MRIIAPSSLSLFILLTGLYGSSAFGADPPISVQVDWNDTVAVSKTTPTVMHMVAPRSRQGAPLHEKTLAALKALDARYPRYLNWHVYPRLAIAELYPPAAGKTSWDFSLIDANLVPFLEATRGHEPVVSFGAIPPWMFKSDQPIVYADDPDKALMESRSHELRDPTGEEVAQYFARIVSWYTQGGFTDENGKYHRSGHHFELPWWEILNEADDYTPQQYTRLSDAIIAAVHQVSPKTRFIGLSLGSDAPGTFEYWLDAAHHRAGIPLDMMTYHFYAVPAADIGKYDASSRSTIDSWQYTFFDQARGFVQKVEYIEAIRKRLSPSTRVDLDELGTYAPGDFDLDAKDTHIAPAYWNLSAGVFAYLYIELSKRGIDILAQSLLATAPGMAPGNTMMDWNTGRPNARYHVLKLLIDNFKPGDRLVSTEVGQRADIMNPDVAAQAFVTGKGRKILLVNKRAWPVEVSLASANRIASIRMVDEHTDEYPRVEPIEGTAVRLEPFAVAVADLAEPTYSQVVGNLLKADVPIRELDSEGRVAVTSAAGRVVALAFSPDGPDLLWSNPLLGDAELVKNHPEKLVGGIGGDRLWFAPELDYHWDGRPDWKTFANYKPPAATDPGVYAFIDQDPHAIELHAKGALPVHGADHHVGFEVTRTVHLAKPPLPKSDPLMKGVDYVGIETSHVLKLADDTHTGLIDLWHLLQAPVGSVLIVPIKKTAHPAQAKPLSYGLPGGWVEKPDHVLWRYGGEAQAKMGLSAAALTGRTAVFRELGPGRWCMIVRQFPVDSNAKYGDHPYGVPRTDQAFQAWDGYGFGEMEFHSPALDAAQGPRELKESDELWAFGGPPQALAALAARLLGVDVGYLFERKQPE